MPRDAQRVQASVGEARRGADADEACTNDDRVGALRRRGRVADAARGRGGGATQHSAPLLQPCWMGARPLLAKAIEAVVAEVAAL